MKEDDVSEPTAALVNQLVEVFQRAERAPDSPMTTLAPASTRREYRRLAAHLREGKAEPRYTNLFTAEELAEIYERSSTAWPGQTAPRSARRWKRCSAR